MAVTFIPNVNFQRVREPMWSGNSYGADNARVLFRGPRPKLIAFLLTIRKFEVMLGFQKMFLDSWSNNDDPVFPAVEFSYVGIRKDEPPVQAIDSYSIQSVSATVTGTSSFIEGKQVNAEFTYRAARTQWSWATSQKPSDVSKYQQTRVLLNPLTQIKSWRISVADGQFTSIDLASFTQLINALTPTMEVSDYEVTEVVPNAFWQCRATVDYVLR